MKVYARYLLLAFPPTSKPPAAQRNVSLRSRIMERQIFNDPFSLQKKGKEKAIARVYAGMRKTEFYCNKKVR